VTIAIGCVCAPLVEEVLFRGLFLESLRRHGTAVALMCSGCAFAVWHLNPAALRYYAVMGVLLGVLYLKRGLVCSMTAHLAFNGVLTVAALAVVLAPTKTVSVGELSVELPGGWSTQSTAFGGDVFSGPSGAELVIAEQERLAGVSPQTMVRRIRDGLLTASVPAGVDVDVSTAREVDLASGTAVEVDLTAQGHRGTFAFVAMRGHVVEVAFMSAGSMKAQADFPRVLDSLRVR